MGKESVNSALFGKTLAELQALAAELGLPKYRAAQVFEAMYRGRVESIEEMTVLPLALREQLVAGGYSVGRPEIVQTAKSVDGTERYLMRMGDGETVETVWMPEGDGGERGDGSEAAAEEADEFDLIEIGCGPTHRDEAAMNGARSSGKTADPSAASGAKYAPDAHPVLDALPRKLDGDGQIYGFGHAGRASGPALRRTRTSVVDYSAASVRAGCCVARKTA